MSLFFLAQVKVSMNQNSYLRRIRRALWHLRHGDFNHFKKWWRRRKFEDSTTSKPVSNNWAPTNYKDYKPQLRRKSFGHLKVAVILDDFSLSAWSHEFDTRAVTPSNWQSVLDEGIDLLFVESAWNGNSGAWQYQLTGASAPSDSLVKLVSSCREAGVPTAFWNKEDPPHFHDFLNTAKLFDHVFTSDANMIDSYLDALPHESIHPMSFAAQPAIHNPIRIPGIHQVGDIAFAGMYFTHKFPERREQMDLLLSAAARISPRLKNGLTIFSRFSGDDPKYQFPKTFNSFVVGSLPYSKMLTAYRDFKVFLNVNSVTDSPSMCARRIFEITASGTPVVTTPSAAIPNYFSDDEVPTVHDQKQAEEVLRGLVNSPELRDRMVHKAQRKIWREHTYTHRAQQLLSVTGLTQSVSSLPLVSIIVSTNRPHQVQHVLQQVQTQYGVKTELILVTHGFQIPQDEFRQKCDSAGLSKIVLLEGAADWTLGRCLNSAIQHASGEFIAKFDDDDLYGPHYLEDQIFALQYSGADVVGKESAFAFLQSSNTLVLRRPEREHRWTDFVAGPTLVGYREIFEKVPFPDLTRGEDTQFLSDLHRAGFRVYSADRFNFIQNRGHASHTWAARDSEFLANGKVHSFGLSKDHVFVD